MNESAASSERFHAHFEQVLAEKLEAANAERRQTLRSMVVAWFMYCTPLVALSVLGFLMQRDWGDFAGFLMYGPLLGLLFGIFVPINRYHTPYKKNFKQSLVAPLVAAYRPGTRYSPSAGIERHELDSSGLFRNPSPNRVRGEDRVDGTIGDVRFRFSEVYAEHEKTWVGDDGQNKSKTIHVFKGLFYVAEFNKHVSGRTYVFPDRAQRLLGGLGQLLQSGDKTYGELVKLEDPEFEKQFVVYSTNQVEARYVLSSSLMRKLVALQARTRKPMRIAIASSHLYVAIETGEDNFEPSLFTPIDRALFQEFWDVLDIFVAIVEELDLDTRIWTVA